MKSESVQIHMATAKVVISAHLTRTVTAASTTGILSGRERKGFVAGSPAAAGTSSNVRGWRRVNHTPEGYATTPSLRVFLGTATFFANLIRRVMGADRRR